MNKEASIANDIIKRNTLAQKLFATAEKGGKKVVRLDKHYMDQVKKGVPRAQIQYGFKS